jgi:hypothetical protein
LILVLLAALAGCGGDDDCGPGETADDTRLELDGETLGYGGFLASANNDCNPETLTSLTIVGVQDGGEREIVFCLPSPDLVESGTPIALDDEAMILFVDLFGEDEGGCTLALDRSTPPTGSVTFTGLCGDGVDPAGFAIELDATVELVRTCDDAGAAATGTLVGTHAVGVEG